MAIGNSAPMRYTPLGLTDAFDATDRFQGAFQRGDNLIFDAENPELVIARPGVTLLQSLAALGFANPTFISVMASAGTRIYGMVTTTRNPGRDEPFCIETLTGLSVSIGGVTAANTPASPATSGDWEPPTMASVGVYVLVTHPGFAGMGNVFGAINLTNPALPVWSMQTTATNALTARPVAVANYNNRAYYAVDNQLQFSDALLPLTRTNATQALVVGDSAAVNAVSGLPMQTTSSGVLAALIAWKFTQTWQVTGDPVTLNLALNYLSLTIGTNSPRTIAQSTLGTYFLSTGGPYFIDPLGTLRPLTNSMNTMDPDVRAPFVNALTPTRWNGCYASSIYRVCGPTVIRGVQSTNDYWFDEHKRRWLGPHSFAYDCATPLLGSFVLSAAAFPGLLMQSDPTPKLTTVYTDMTAPFTIALVSSTFPKVADMSQKQVSESQIELGGTATYLITAQDTRGATLGQVTINATGPNPPLWGGGPIWGNGTLWTSGQRVAPLTYPVPWTAPLVFEKMQLAVSAIAGAQVQIGTFYARYQKTGYMVPFPA